jgi:hypothetical protein
MKQFLRSHTNTILVFLAIVFLGLIIAYFSWGIGYLVQEVNQANSNKITATSIPSFDLQGASMLDYRGIAVGQAAIASSTISTTSTTTTGVVATSTATTSTRT